MGDNSFDDMFNPGLYRTNLKNTTWGRPALWNKSVSEMRNYTSYNPQGMPTMHDVGHSQYMTRRRPYVRPRSMQRSGALQTSVSNRWMWTDAGAR